MPATSSFRVAPALPPSALDKLRLVGRGPAPPYCRTALGVGSQVLPSRCPGRAIPPEYRLEVCYG